MPKKELKTDLPAPPDKPGIYQARNGGYEWYNLILEIEGKVPYLHVAWCIDRVDNRRVKVESHEIQHGSIIFGPCLVEGEES